MVKPDLVFPVKEQTELMVFLVETLQGKSRNNIKSLLTNQQVEVNGKTISKHNYLLKPGYSVKIKRERVAPVQSFKGFSIVYEDEQLVVIDKQAGVLSIATQKEREHTAYSYLSSHVKKENPEQKIFIVHRLDRETSGLMVFAKNKKVQNTMQENWRNVLVERAYVAVVEGSIEESEGTIESYLHENKAFVVYSNQDPEDGKHAITNYTVLRKNEKYSLLEVRLKTGRKNQIRVHMQDIGHPIINDKKYGSTQNPIGRMGLHSQILAFIHPVTQKTMHFETPIPSKFLSLF